MCTKETLKILKISGVGCSGHGGILSFLKYGKKERALTTWIDEVPGNTAAHPLELYRPEILKIVSASLVQASMILRYGKEEGGTNKMHAYTNVF